MPFDWEEYLNVARQHLGENVFPIAAAKDRCAISRAYYAALIGMRDFVKRVDRGADIGEGGDLHNQLPKWCSTQPDGRYIDIGQKLMRMRHARNRADYNSEDMPRSADAADMSVRNSQAVFADIRSLGL